jgi:hypothetical protein
LTPQLRAQILAGIRAGGYPHVAAQAWGVSRELLDDWLRRGSGSAAREPYRLFAHDVRQAHAQARLRAEFAVFQDDPKVWLEHGPGREGPDNPGWTVSVKPVEPGPDGSRNVLGDPEIMAIFQLVLHALMPYPEARACVADQLLQVAK